MFKKALIQCPRCGRWHLLNRVRVGDAHRCRCGKRIKIAGVAPIERLRRAYRADSNN